MPTELKQTTIRRNHKRKKMGKFGKALRENHGTTAAFPLEGPIPALRYGRPVEPESIKVPADLLK